MRMHYTKPRSPAILVSVFFAKFHNNRSIEYWNHIIFLETKEEANNWMQNHRSKQPAVYNTARLIEQPIPEDPNAQQSLLVVESISFNFGGNSSISSNFDRSAEPDPLANISNIENGEISIDEVIIISDDEEENGAIGGDRANVNSLRAEIIIKNEPDGGPSNSGEAARKSNCAVSTEKSITKPLHHSKLPPPISCKLEYDKFSGFVPFVVNVSEKVIRKMYSMYSSFICSSRSKY